MTYKELKEIMEVFGWNYVCHTIDSNIIFINSNSVIEVYIPFSYGEEEIPSIEELMYWEIIKGQRSDEFKLWEDLILV